jgi:hypothetical protein
MNRISLPAFDFQDYNMIINKAANRDEQKVVITGHPRGPGFLSIKKISN